MRVTDNLKADARRPPVDHSQLFSDVAAHVEGALRPPGRAAIVDATACLASVVEVGDEEHRAEGQGAMRAGEARSVEVLAGSGAVAALPPVEAGDAGLSDGARGERRREEDGRY